MNDSHHNARLDSFRAAVTLDPGSPQFFYALSEHLQQSGQYDDAVKWLKKAVGLQPDFSQEDKNKEPIAIMPVRIKSFVFI